MATEIMPKETDIVKKSNALARAAYNPTSINEARLVALVASQIKKSDTDFKSYYVRVTDFIDTPTGGSVYDAVKKMAEAAMKQTLKIDDPDGWTIYNLFSRCRYQRSQGTLDVQIHPDLISHYLNLKKNFTQYRLTEYLALPSVYSQRIYEIVRSCDDRTEFEFDITQLHKMLCTPASMRRDFHELKRYALDKAHKDIHKYTKLKFEWEPIRKGRKVIAVRFYMGKKTKAKVVKANKQKTDKKQMNKNNKLFLQAVQCAQAHKDQGGCGQLRGTKECCKACMKPKKPVETELNLFDQESTND